LYLKKIELGSFAAGLVMPNIGRNHGSRLAVERAQLESEINSLEKKGAVALSFDQALPEEYRECLWEDFELPMNEKQAEKAIQRFKKYLYLTVEVINLQFTGEEAGKDAGDGFLPISLDKSLKWSDITIKFLNENEIHIQFKEGAKALNITRRFDQIGFGDGRKGGDIPVLSWKLFYMFAEKGSIIHSFENRSAVESSVKDLRKKLRAMFPSIEEDPIPHVKKDKEYRCNLNLSLAESSLAEISAEKLKKI